MRHKLKRTVFLIIGLFIINLNSMAYAKEFINFHVPDAQKIGEGRLTFLFMDIYDATLYAPNGQWSNGPPFALELLYHRDLNGNRIADRSIEEMRKQGLKDEMQLKTWLEEMNKIFPDVSENTSLVGIYTKEGTSIFYKDGLEIGRVIDPEFGNAFFNIWLSEKTTEPELRRKLLGLEPKV